MEGDDLPRPAGRLTGGIAMATWAAGRRTATAFDRLVAFSRLADTIVTVCPRDVTELDETALARCLAYEPTEEVETIRALPEVEAAGRGAFRPLTAAPADAPDQTEMAGGFFAGDVEMPDVSGRPILLEGRLYDTSSADEVVVNEYFRDRFGVAVGDELSLTFQTPEEIGATATDGERYHGPAARVRVVGVVRSLRDLAARTASAPSLLDEAVILGGPGVWEATPGAAGYGGIVVRSRGGASETNRAIEDALEGRLLNIAPADGADDIDPIREAISYEARGALALAALAGLAVAVFGGQAVARQSRKEWSDRTALDALGLSNRQATAPACEVS
jgi:hypothetical protein